MASSQRTAPYRVYKDTERGSWQVDTWSCVTPFPTWATALDAAYRVAKLDARGRNDTRHVDYLNALSYLAFYFSH